MSLILPQGMTPQKQTKIPFEKIVSDDVKKLAGDYVKGDPTALQRAIDAEITINVGVALQTYFKAEHFDRFSSDLGNYIAKELRENS